MKTIFLLAILGIFATTGYWYFSDKNDDSDKNKTLEIKSLASPSKTVNHNDYFAENSFDGLISEIQPISLRDGHANPKLTDLKKFLQTADLKKDISVFDKKIGNFLRDKTLTRASKLAFLINMLKEFGFNSAKGGYMLDALAGLKPIEIADYFIEQFNNPEFSNDVKAKLMRTLVEAYSIDPSKYPPDIAKLIGQKSNDIQSFFNQQIEKPINSELYREAIKLYPHISSTDELHLLNDSLLKHQDLISIKESLNVQLEVSLGNQDIQATALPELLQTVQKGKLSAEVKNEFNERLYALIKAPGAEKVIDESVKPQLANYLQQQTPLLNNSNVNFNNAHNYVSWLDAYASVNGGNDKVSFISNLVSSASPVQQAAVIVFSDGELLNSLQQDFNLQTNLNSALNYNNLTTESKQIILDAVNKLQESNSSFLK